LIYTSDEMLDKYCRLQGLVFWQHGVEVGWKADCLCRQRLPGYQGVDDDVVRFIEDAVIERLVTLPGTEDAKELRRQLDEKDVGEKLNG
jgi:hypothetical protein